jgi:hypothetical protein
MTSYVQGVKTVETPVFTGSIVFDADARIIAENYVETTGNVWSITNTPGSNCDADIVKITAAGTNWVGGSCLYLTTDDGTISPLVVEQAAFDTACISMLVSGVEKGEIGIGAAGGLYLATTSNGDIQFLPNGTGITVVGDAGSTSQGLNSNDDMFVAGELEADGPIYADGGLVLGNGFPADLNGANVSLADDASTTVLAHASTTGFLHVQAGDDDEWARCRFNSSGTVVLEANSANVANSDSDTDLCIYSTGGNLVIKNRLGSTKQVAYRVTSWAV